MNFFLGGLISQPSRSGVLGLHHSPLVGGGRAETFSASLPTFAFLVNLCNKYVINTVCITHVISLPKNAVKGEPLLLSP